MVKRTIREKMSIREKETKQRFGSFRQTKRHKGSDKLR